MCDPVAVFTGVLIGHGSASSILTMKGDSMGPELLRSCTMLEYVHIQLMLYFQNV